MKNVARRILTWCDSGELLKGASNKEAEVRGQID